MQAVASRTVDATSAALKMDFSIINGYFSYCFIQSCQYSIKLKYANLWNKFLKK